jgi:hypothetical protein
MERQRTTRFNSGNFFGVDVSLFTPSFVEHNVSSKGYVQFSPRWGVRRVYSEKWLFEFDLGVNVATTGDDWGTSPRLGIKWGYLF